MTLVTILATSFVLALSGAMMPGPLFTATINESMQRGPLAGPLLIVGHATLELVLVLGLVFGLAPWLQSDTAFAVIALAGASILAWMAVGMLKSVRTLSLSAIHQPSQSGRRLVASGILLSLSNPYWLLWWATIGLGYVLAAQSLGLPGVAAFFLGHIAADFAWYALCSAAMAKGKSLLNDQIYRGLITGCAVFLLGFAGYFLYSGLNRLVS